MPTNSGPSPDNKVVVVFQSLSHFWTFAIPWIAALQASLSFTISQSLVKLMSIELVMPSNNLILCHSLLLPSIFPRTIIFSSESAVRYQVARVLELQHQSFHWIFRVDFLKDWLVWSPCCPRDSQESSPAPHFDSVNSPAHSLLYGPTLTFVHWVKP